MEQELFLIVNQKKVKDITTKTPSFDIGANDYAFYKLDAGDFFIRLKVIVPDELLVAEIGSVEISLDTKIKANYQDDENPLKARLEL